MGRRFYSKPADYQPVRHEAPAQWGALLDRALTEPGRLSECYSMWYSYSPGNQLAAMWQCMERKIDPGPMAGYVTWQTLGRQVRKGEKALILCRPLTFAKDKPDGNEEPDIITRFVWKPTCFVLSQTDASPGRADYKQPEPPEWDKAAALAALDVLERPFVAMDGSIQGYARPTGRVLAINPLNPHGFSTLVHELAHIILHGEADKTDRQIAEAEAESTAYIVCASLGMGESESSRAYVQGWLAGGLHDSLC